MFWGAKKNLIYFSNRIEKLHKIKFKKIIYFFLNLIILFKLELSPQIFITKYSIPYTQDGGYLQTQTTLLDSSQLIISQILEGRKFWSDRELVGT